MSKREREQHDEQERGGPTTFPPTPGDRNEQARAQRGFGRPAESGAEAKGDEEAESNRAS